MHADPMPVTPVTPSAPTIDLGAFVNGIVNGFSAVLSTWSDNTWRVLSTGAQDWLNTSIQYVWNQIWSSDANVFVTPHDLVTGFPAVVLLFHALVPAIYGIVYVSVVLLGIAMLLKPVFHDDFFYSLFHNVLMGAFLGGLGWMIADSAIVAIGRISSAIGRTSWSPAFGTTFQNWGITVLVFLVLIVMSVRVAYRQSYRLILLGFLAPFSPIFGALFGIPMLKPAAALYWWTYLGWAVGGFLSVAAMTLGIQMALAGHAGLWSILFGVAMLGLAHDIIPWLARGALSRSTPSLRFFAGVAGAGAIGGGATAAAATAAAASSAERPSYGYA